MYQGKLTAGEQKKLIKAKDVIDAWIRYQRENPKVFDPARTYVAMDASRAIEAFLMTMQ